MSEGIDLDKLANFVIMGVPGIQIADCFGVSEGRISQLRDTAEFKEILLKKYAEERENQKEFNEGWDEIEKKSIKIVVDRLKYTKDPEFALRAATLANKAMRRGGIGIAPILPTDVGPRVVVNINQQYLMKLQNADLNIPQVAENIQKKVDMLNPQKVLRLLEGNSLIDDEQNPVLEELPD